DPQYERKQNPLHPAGV
ncbi:unnamed protein product, partial [Parascedosporium putredinis]